MSGWGITLAKDGARGRFLMIPNGYRIDEAVDSPSLYVVRRRNQSVLKRDGWGCGPDWIEFWEYIGSYSTLERAISAAESDLERRSPP